MPLSHHELRLLLSRRPVILAPMEDTSDAVFRRICRARGADLCFSEFVRVERLLARAGDACRKTTFTVGDAPTAIQIYGASAEHLASAARAAEALAPAFVDINCGCAVPRITRGGAGAGWLRDPDAMVAMAAAVVRRTSLPVTVKTRIGLGTEAEMPICDLAQRLEDVGVQALTLHCRTAAMGFGGAADWSVAARVRQLVSFPVIVNGDIRSAEDAVRALRDTGCAGVMIGRRALEHPWIFRECRSLLDEGVFAPPPTPHERLGLLREQLLGNIEQRSERWGVQVTRRHLAGYLSGLPGAARMRRAMLACDHAQGWLDLLDAAAAMT